MHDTAGLKLQRDVNRFAETLKLIRTTPELVDAIMKVIRPLRYKSVASGIFVDPNLKNTIHFANWDPDVMRIYVQNGFMRIDPAPIWALKSGMAISMSELRTLLPKDHPGHLVYETVEGFGYRGGYIIPQRSYDNMIGLVTFLGERDPQTTLERISLRSLAYLAFEHAEKLSGRPQQKMLTIPPAALTPKEQICLKYLADGKSIAEIATLMAVSEATVRFHTGNLRRKTRTTSRSKLVAVAIASSLVPRS